MVTWLLWFVNHIGVSDTAERGTWAPAIQRVFRIVDPPPHSGLTCYLTEF